MYDLDTIHYSGIECIEFLIWRNSDLETQKFLFTFRVYVGWWGVRGAEGDYLPQDDHLTIHEKYW